MEIQGSSPLARGLLTWSAALNEPERIIPARAGSTMWRILTMISRLDHPRSRGVYNISTQIAETGIGSSPLARGLRLDPGANLGGGGIIPARAGSTNYRRRSSESCRDHPRSRGVYVSPSTSGL